MSAPVLVCDGLRVRRGGKTVIDGCSLQVGRGEVVAVIGPNGIGKSTLLAAIAGVLPLRSGIVSVAGARGTAARRRLGFAPEGANPPPHYRGVELLSFVAAVKRGARSAAVEEAMGVDELLAARIDEMSLGQRRRICLAAAWVGAPELLVLDEPTNGLTGGYVSALQALAASDRERGAGWLLSTHDLEFAAALGARLVPLGK